MPSAKHFLEQLRNDLPLGEGLGDIPLNTKSTDLQEFQHINAASEPQGFYMHMLRISNPKVPKRNFDELKTIAQTPSMSKTQFVTIYKRFKVENDVQTPKVL